MSRAPTNWPEVSLGDVCEFKYGKSLPEVARTGGPVPVFGSNGIVGQHDEALTNGPTIVIGRKGSFGEVKFSPRACWPIDTTYYVDGTSTEADLRWLAYRLASLALNKLNRAAAVPGLNREDAYRKTLLLPPPSDQRRIAELLDRADALRAKRRAALAKLDTLTQAIFLDMFGIPLDASGTCRRFAT
jgi:type I restriction enzyme S subunit